MEDKGVTTSRRSDRKPLSPKYKIQFHEFQIGRCISSTYISSVIFLFFNHRTFFVSNTFFSHQVLHIVLLAVQSNILLGSNQVRNVRSRISNTNYPFDCTWKVLWCLLSCKLKHFPLLMHALKSILISLEKRELFYVSFFCHSNHKLKKISSLSFIIDNNYHHYLLLVMINNKLKYY